MKIVVNRGYVWSPGQGWQVVDSLEVMIGVMDGSSHYELSQVTGATRLANGGVAVADAGTAEIRIFDAAGRFVRTAGGSGRGSRKIPATEPALVPIGPTSLLAWDYRLRRATVYTAAGEYARDVRPQLAPHNPISVRPSGTRDFSSKIGRSI